MTFADSVRATVLVFAASVVQVSVLGATTIGSGAPDLAVCVLVSIALLRGSIAGALAGFGTGLLLDAATLGTLGVSSLVLTLVGYWIGRYAETTSEGWLRHPGLALAGGVIAARFVSYLVHTLLSEAVSPREALVTTLAPAVAVNVVLGLAVYAGCRTILGPRHSERDTQGVEILV